SCKREGANSAVRGPAFDPNWMLESGLTRLSECGEELKLGFCVEPPSCKREGANSTVRGPAFDPNWMLESGPTRFSECGEELKLGISVEPPAVEGPWLSK